MVFFGRFLDPYRFSTDRICSLLANGWHKWFRASFLQLHLQLPGAPYSYNQNDLINFKAIFYFLIVLVGMKIGKLFRKPLRF